MGEVYLQVKATDTLPRLKNADVISWRLLRSDLARWLHSSVPVILAVYDAVAECAYWLYVQCHFQSLPEFNLFAQGRTVTVRVPASNVLDTDAVRLFAQLRDAVSLQTQGVIDHDA